MTSTYGSFFNLALGQIPNITDQATYQTLLDIHNAISNLAELESREQSVTLVSASYTVTPIDRLVVVQAATSISVITLPEVSTALGLSFTVKRMPSATADVTISSSSLIDEVAADLLLAIGDAHTLKATPDGYVVVS